MLNKKKFFEMTREEELKSIGLMRRSEILRILRVSSERLNFIIKDLKLVPFEKCWYDEYQLDLIRNFKK